jgi:single-strand selective monofunctional uracil DNA glycosylase
MSSTPHSTLIDSTRRFSRRLERLSFVSPVCYVYNPLRYAWAPHATYLERYAGSPIRIMLVGMNPGPWGMAQTGVPFGEVNSVRDWLGIEEKVGQPKAWHKRVPVSGFACPRSEVSGSRLWGLLKEHYGSADQMRRELVVSNYCPLLFLDEAGTNLTPDKIGKEDRAVLYAACDAYVAEAIKMLRPEWVLGIGRFVEKQLNSILPALPAGIRVAALPHPSPASPQANRGWAEQARKVMVGNGIWA